MHPVFTALIPVYEPEKTFLPFLASVRESGLEVVVVNDGSDDSYSEVFEKARTFAHVITYPENRGKGSALKTGIRYILETWPDALIVTIDADGQHTVTDAWRLLRQVSQDPSALWIGVRTGLDQAPWPSRFGNALTRKITAGITGSDLQDTQSGLRAFDSGMGRRLLNIEGDRYEFEMNEILELSRTGIPIRQLPIQTIYVNGNKSSHFRRIRDSLRIYRQLLKFAASSLISFCIDFLLYSLLYLLLNGTSAAARVFWSNIPARIISASINFALNRRLVFDSGNSLAKSALKYFLLAALILAVNTLLITFFTDGLGWNGLLSKLLAEMLCFFISFTVQKFWIFNKQKEMPV